MSVITVRRLRASLGVERKDVPGVIERAWAIHNGMGADPSTYIAPVPPLPEFLVLLEDLVGAQVAVRQRTVGAADRRNVRRDLLWSAMESQCQYVQGLADASPELAAVIIVNAGLLVAGDTSHGKALLTLKNGMPSGTVECDANVGLLVRTAGKKLSQYRLFNWELTVDGGESFLSLPATPTGKTTIHNLTPLTRVGVRVSMTTSDGPGPWSQVITILVI